MASAAAPATPVRAIQTQLKAKSSPPIPPSSRVYDPIVKSVLRHRLTNNVLLYSALCTWAVASAWEMWERLGGSGGSSSLVPFMPATLLKASIGWIAGAVPAIVLRKLYLSTKATNAVTRSGLIRSGFSQPQTPTVAFIYAASAVLALLVNIVSVYTSDAAFYSDPKLAPFVRSRKHPYYLNGRFVFLLLSQLFVAVGFCFRNITADRFAFGWRSTVTGENARPGTGHLISVAVVAVGWSTLTLVASVLLFGVARFFLPILYMLPVLPYFLRPFTAHFLRGSFTVFLPLFHLPLLFRAWFLAFSTISTWEFANVFFETCIQQPISVVPSSAQPEVALAAGVASPDLVFRFYAYLELQKLAAEDTAAAKSLRENIFNDQHHTPSLWSQLVRESLVQLGQDYQLFLRRGAPAPAALPAPVPAPAAGPKIESTPIPLIKTSIFKQNKPSPISNVITSLGSDGTFSKALDEGAEAAHIPQIFKSVEQSVIPAGATEAISKSVAVTMSPSVVTQVKERACASVKGVVEKYAPGAVKKGWEGLKVWWTRERVHKFVESTLPYAELDLAIVNVLSFMVCASLSDDKYGVVQRDIPKILEAMTSFRSAVGEYKAEVKGKYVPPANDKDLSNEEIAKNEILRDEVNLAVERLAVAEAGLTEGIARIVRTFGAKLSAFKFPPRIAQQLQAFVEY